MLFHLQEFNIKTADGSYWAGLKGVWVLGWTVHKIELWNHVWSTHWLIHIDIGTNIDIHS